MIDNPQNKLNKQAQSNKGQSDSFNSQPPAISSKPSPSKVNTDPQLQDQAPSHNLQYKENQTQTADTATQQGFNGKLKSKLANQNSSKLQTTDSAPSPDQRKAQTDTPSHRDTPATPSPKTPKAKSPKPNIPRPSLPSAQLPKIPKPRFKR